MLSFQARLFANKEGITSKLFEGEAIIVNLSTGVYYSMEKVGAMIWQMIEEGCSLQEITAAITARYDVSSEQTQADAERLIRELLQENLVKVSEHTAPSLKPHGEDPQPRLPYESPSLHIYRDIGELWALDPPMPLDEIHWKEPTDGPLN